MVVSSFFGISKSKETFSLNGIKPIERPKIPWFARVFVDIAGIALSAVTGGESLIASIAIDSAIVAGTTTAQTVLDYAETGKVNALTIGLGALPVLGGVYAGGKAISLGRKVDKLSTQLFNTPKTIIKTESKIQKIANTSIKRNQINEVSVKLAKKEIDINGSLLKFQKAGLTEEESLQSLIEIQSTFKSLKIKNKLLDQQISFIKQETEIAKTLASAGARAGLTFGEISNELSKFGINFSGIRSSSKFVREIKFANLDNKIPEEIISSLEKEIQQSLEPSFMTRYFNALKLERGVVKTNKLLSLLNPETLISEGFNKIFDPIKAKVFKNVFEPIKKKASQKLKHMFRQNILRKAQTKNGVFPCFGSSWINYLRAVPLGKTNEYKCFVVFRKWGYQPVLITPLMTLEEIINWSESSSPGRIYHQFRKKYALEKGSYVEMDESNESLFFLFNAMGFIPDKYISLGVSLIGNLVNAATTIAMHKWENFSSTEIEFAGKNLNDKMFEVLGGQFGKGFRDQLTGQSPTAIRDYFTGKLKEKVESKESEQRKRRKENEGKIGAVLSIQSILK